MSGSSTNTTGSIGIAIYVSISVSISISITIAAAIAIPIAIDTVISIDNTISIFIFIYISVVISIVVAIIFSIYIVVDIGVISYAGFHLLLQGMGQFFYYLDLYAEARVGGVDIFNCLVIRWNNCFCPIEVLGGFLLHDNIGTIELSLSWRNLGVS